MTAPFVSRLIHAVSLVLLLALLSSCLPTTMQMGTQITRPRIEDDVFVTRDRTQLPVSVWGPRDNLEKIVLAAHSFDEFRNAYALIGDHLASQGIAVWAYD